MTKRNNLPAQQSNMNHWDKIVKNFPLTDNCIIMTIRGSSVGHQKNMQDIANAINRMDFKNVVVGSVQSFDHIEVLNEAEMARGGWMRQERIGLRVAIALDYARIIRWISMQLKKLKRKSNENRT